VLVVIREAAVAVGILGARAVTAEVLDIKTHKPVLPLSVKEQSVSASE